MITTTGSVFSSDFDSNSASENINIGANQTDGILYIGSASNRTGAINIGTGQTDGTSNIIIGSTGITGAGNQTITFNRPITTNNNAITAGTGSISGGAINCTSISTNLGSVIAGQILILNNTFATISSISTTGALTCSRITLTTRNTNFTGTLYGDSDTILAADVVTGYSTLRSPSINAIADTGNVTICSNQTTGTLDIGVSNLRTTGAINIGTGNSIASQPINIGSSNNSSTQTVTINRPISMPGFIYSVGNQIGYFLNIPAFYSTAEGNLTESGVKKDTLITTTNLIHNADYLINYSISFKPTVDFNATKLQFGLYSSSIGGAGFIPHLSQNLHMLYGLTGSTSVRYLTSEEYCYSGSGFLKYRSTTTYLFSHIMVFVPTAPNILVNVNFIRIS